MKAYGGVDIYIQIFLTSALVGGQWSASRTGRFIPWERARGTHWRGGWMDHRAGLDNVENRTFLTLPDSNSHPTVVQAVASRYTDCAIPAPLYLHKTNAKCIVLFILICMFPDRRREEKIFNRV
jgi:hypothetical protein